MSVHNSLFRMDFKVTGGRSFDKMRNRIKGVGEQSYQTFNAISRSLSKLEKQTGRTINKFGRMAMGGGLLYGAFRTLNYSLLQSNSLIQTNTILLEEMFKSKSKAHGFISVIENIAGAFGQDLTELMSSSRGLVQTMGQAFGNKLKPQHLEKMLKLLMTVHSLDTENRPLSFTAFSFKEMFQGQGALDFRSLRSRLEINLGREVEKGITNAIKSKNIGKAMDLINQAFVNIGIDSEKIMQRFLKQGVSQNISRFSSFILRLFQNLGKSSFQELIRPLAMINAQFVKLFTPDSSQYKTLQAYSEQLRVNVIKPLVDEFQKMFMAFGEQKDYFIKNFINMIKSSGQTLQSFGGIFGAFFSGIAGQDMNTKDYQKMFEDINAGMIKFNSILKSTKSIFETIQTPIHMIGKAINLMVSAISSLPAPLLALAGLGVGAKALGFGGKVASSTARRFTGMGGTKGATGGVASNVATGSSAGGISGMDALSMAGNLAMIGSILPMGKLGGAFKKFKGSSKNISAGNIAGGMTDIGKINRINNKFDKNIKTIESNWKKSVELSNQNLETRKLNAFVTNNARGVSGSGGIFNKNKASGYMGMFGNKSEVNKLTVMANHEKLFQEQLRKQSLGKIGSQQFGYANVGKAGATIGAKTGFDKFMNPLMQKESKRIAVANKERLRKDKERKAKLDKEMSKHWSARNIGDQAVRGAMYAQTGMFMKEIGGKFLPALTKVRSGFSLLATIFPMLTNPFLAIPVAIGGVIASMGLLESVTRRLNKAFESRQILIDNANMKAKSQSDFQEHHRRNKFLLKNFGFNNKGFKPSEGLNELLQDPKRYLQHMALYTANHGVEGNNFLKYLKMMPDAKTVKKFAESQNMTEEQFRQQYNIPAVNMENTTGKLKYGTKEEQSLYKVLVDFDVKGLTEDASKKIKAILYQAIGEELEKTLSEKENDPNNPIKADSVLD